MPSRIFVSQHPPFRTRNYQAFTEFERTGPASACRSGALRSRESRADSLSRKTRYPRMWRPDSEWIVGYPEVIAKYPLVEVGDLATEVQGSAVSGGGRRVTSDAAERPERRRAGCQPASRGTQGDGTGAPRTNRSNRAARGVGTKLSGGGCIGLCYVVLFGSRATLHPVIAFRRVPRRNGLAPSRRRARSRAPRRSRGPR